jgi:hypothetical protein
MLDQFGPYQDVAGYQIRVPKGWVASPVKASPGEKIFAWYGLRPNDKKGAVLRFYLIEPPDPTSPDYEEFKKATLESVFDDCLKSVAKGAYGSAEKEFGRINGIPFARVNLAIRNEADEGYVVQCVAYVGKNGLSVATLTFSDVEPYYTKSAKLGISAILTFRKSP